MEEGLDMAIVNAQKIIPLYKIDEKGRELCRRLVFDERAWDGDRCTSDPLMELMAYYADKKHSVKTEKKERTGTIEEILKNRIIDGDKQDLTVDLQQALKTYPALEIINTILLDGMKVVGELFGRGGNAASVCASICGSDEDCRGVPRAIYGKSESSTKGTMVLATVKGDVHDIGKNLVDIILTNNGYTVYNLGIKQPIDTIIRAFEEHNADAIGMSGLLVKSTLMMKENLEVLSERGLHPPVVLGGAALTRRYVEQDLQPLYKGIVSYANDAFDGLRFMEKLKQKGVDGFAAERPVSTDIEDSEELLVGSEAKIALALKEENGVQRSAVTADVPIPAAPFWGIKSGRRDFVERSLSLHQRGGAYQRASGRFVRKTHGRRIPSSIG